MNKVVLMGRLTRDPDVRYSQNSDQPLAIARYTLAVDRPFRSRNNNGNNGQNADFINCKAFGKAGEFVEKYLHKGTKICVSGRIETGSYTNKEGQTVYTTEVVVDEHEFAESKNSGNGGGGDYSRPQSAPSGVEEGFINIPEGIDDEVPFDSSRN